MLVVGVALALPSGAWASVKFSSPTDLTAHTSPWAVVVGDFNEDGKPDLAVSNHTSSDVSILLSDGSGHFSGATNYAVAGSADALAIGDFNRDGHEDLAVAGDNLAGGLSVLLGTGSGSFEPNVHYTAGSGNGLASVAVADLNADGNPDIVEGTPGGAVYRQLGDGTGAFGTSTQVYGAGSGQTWVSVGDFDGDGTADVAAASINSHTVVSLLGNGSGGFTTGSTTTLASGTFPQDLAVGDFNRDGKQDVAVVEHAISVSKVAALIGDGSGAFTFTEYGTGDTSPSDVAVGDVDGDGKQDLAVANGGSSFSILQGDGAGGFGTAVNFAATGTSPEGIALHDLNGDGAPDVVLAGGSGNVVKVFLNSGTADPSPGSLGFGTSVPQGTVSAPQTVTLTNNGSAPLSVAGFEMQGANPNDFFTGTTTCGAAVAPGGSCTVQVRFAPQAQGARSATLTTISNASSGGSVTLTGTGGPLPQGPVGPAGAAGVTGATGAPGPAGPAGRIELVTCSRVTVRSHGRRVKRNRCRTRLVSGTVQFKTAVARNARASLARGHRIYAVGRTTRHGVVLHARRRIKPGRYSLILRYRRGGREIVTRTTLRIG